MVLDDAYGPILAPRTAKSHNRHLKSHDRQTKIFEKIEILSFSNFYLVLAKNRVSGAPGAPETP